jgi:hypothetical protein
MTGMRQLYVVRPIVRHFAGWVLLALLVLFEARAFQALANEFALHDPDRIARSVAQVTASRNESGDVEIQYRFQVGNNATWYSATDLTGRQNLWIAVTAPAWAEITGRNGLVEVVYLPQNPWANEPVGRAGDPIRDSVGMWLMILMVDAYSVYEGVQVVRQFVRCRDAAERGEPCRSRYWETRAV